MLKRGSKLLLAVAAEAVKLYYKLEDSKVSDVLGPVPRLPAPKRKLVLNGFGFPVKLGGDGEEAPLYACLIYVAGHLILGKRPEELALRLGEKPDKAKAMYEEGVKWAARLAYLTTRLAYLARDEKVRDLGVKLMADSIWTALSIYSTTSGNTSMYGLFRNLSKEVFDAPSEEEAENLKKEIAMILSDEETLKSIMEGEAPPANGEELDLEAGSRASSTAEGGGGGSDDPLAEIRRAALKIKRASYGLSEVARQMEEALRSDSS